MKKKLLFSLLSAAILTFLMAFTSVSAQEVAYEGDITFTSQAQLDAFDASYNTIVGDVNCGWMQLTSGDAYCFSSIKTGKVGIAQMEHIFGGKQPGF